MNLDKRNLLIVILSVALLIVGYIAYNPKRSSNNDAIMKTEIQRLVALNQQTIELIAERDIKIIKFATQIDSLEHLKPQIHIKYVTKYKEINDANANSVANEFKRVFTNANIK
jgi:hypothetical protein